jgi:hypothetical protein
LGIRCQCSAVASGGSQINTTINGVTSFGFLSVAIVNVCPNCSPNDSEIFFTYTDDIDPNNSFNFMSTIVDLPICFVEGGVNPAMMVSAQGNADGVNFSGPAILINMTLIENINNVCDIQLTAGGNSFQQLTCAIVGVDITDPCQNP